MCIVMVHDDGHVAHHGSLCCTCRYLPYLKDMFRLPPRTSELVWLEGGNKRK